jgi:hypothetical protein
MSMKLVTIECPPSLHRIIFPSPLIHHHNCLSNHLFTWCYWQCHQIFIGGHPSRSCVASGRVIREYITWLKWCTTVVIWTDNLLHRGPLGGIGRFCGYANGDSDCSGGGGSFFFGVGCNSSTMRSMLGTISRISMHILDVNCIIRILNSHRCSAWVISSPMMVFV